MAREMTKVVNWQLGRAMDYPYPSPPPQRQVAWVFDTNKCIACQTCTMACKTTWTSGRGQEDMWWNNVETKPWGFYPLGWDVRLLERLGPGRWESGVYRGRTVFEAVPPGEQAEGFVPEADDWAHPNLGEDEICGQVNAGMHIEGIHNVWMFYLQRICNHCSYPACLGACPRKAIYKRREDGIVLIDQERCRGYQECVKCCPYKKSMYHAYTRKSQKCIACYPAVGQGFQTQCVVNCIGKIRIFGFINPPERAEADNPLDYLVHVARVAKPLYPQFGTQPNVYYVPPIHVPPRFLMQMFGPDVEAAVRTYRAAAEDKTLRGLLVLIGSTDRIIHRFAVRGDAAIAYDERGSEILRVPVVEPTARRPFYDEKHHAYRHSVT